MEKVWTRYRPLLVQVRDQWPEQPGGIDPADVIEALAVLHGLGRTIHEGGNHHQRAVALYRAYLRQQAAKESSPEGVRRLLRTLVIDLDAEQPGPVIQAVYDEYVRMQCCVAHELGLLIEQRGADAAHDALRATG